MFAEGFVEGAAQGCEALGRVLREGVARRGRMKCTDFANGGRLWEMLCERLCQGPRSTRANAAHIGRLTTRSFVLK